MAINHQDAAKALPDALRSEIAKLEPFADHAAASRAINGADGGEGLRTRYLNALYRHASAGKLSDIFITHVGASIGVQCDRAVALCVPIQCTETRWTSHPIDCLTQAERDALKPA